MFIFLSAAKVQVVYEVKCPRALTCSQGCSVGYKCSTDGCPTCDCIEPQSELIYPLSIIVCEMGYTLVCLPF